MSTNCYVCGYPVWGDDWDIYKNEIIHEDCKAEAIAKSKGLEKYQVIKISVNVNIRMIKKWKIIMYKKWPKAFQIPSSNYYLSTEF